MFNNKDFVFTNCDTPSYRSSSFVERSSTFLRCRPHRLQTFGLVCFNEVRAVFLLVPARTREDRFIKQQRAFYAWSDLFHVLLSLIRAIKRIFIRTRFAYPNKRSQTFRLQGGRSYTMSEEEQHLCHRSLRSEYDSNRVVRCPKCEKAKERYQSAQTRIHSSASIL